MARWYWMKDGQKQGPVDTASLKQMARAGQLLSTDMIWRDGLPNWVPASEAKGLEFSAKTSAQAAGGTAAVAAAPIRAGATQHPPAAHGLIKYQCANCGGVLESEGRFAGKHDTCPMCGKVTGVPLLSTAGAGAFFRRIPKAVYVGAAATVVVAVVSLSAWLALRDTWERDHGDELRQMTDETISLIRAGKNEEGVAKYEAMLAFVGDRQFQDPKLRQDLTHAKQGAETARHHLEEQHLETERQQRLAAEAEARRKRDAEDLAKLHSLEAKAEAFILRSDLQNGIAYYTEAIDLARQMHAKNPEFSTVIDHLLSAIKAAELQAQTAAVRTRSLAATKQKLSSYYGGPLQAGMHQLENVDAASQPSPGEADIAWHKRYGQAYQALLKAEEQRIKDMPFFAEEERNALGDTWKTIEAADAALAARIRCAINLHKHALDLLFQAIDGQWPGAEGELSAIIGQVIETAHAYSLQAAMHYKYAGNLIEQGLLDEWPTRLAKEGLSCDRTQTSAKADAAIAASVKAQQPIREIVKGRQAIMSNLKLCVDQLAIAEARRADLANALRRWEISQNTMDSLAEEVQIAQQVQAARGRLDAALQAYNSSVKRLVSRHTAADIAVAGKAALQSYAGHEHYCELLRIVLYGE